MNIEKLLSVILWLTALHSFLVGLLLILLPTSAIVYFGFESYEHNFFRVQGGVFHIVMAMFYIAAATDVNKHILLIKLIIVTKFFAAIFLISYYAIISHVLIILISGIGDFLIGFVIMILFLSIKKRRRDGEMRDERRETRDERREMRDER